MGKCTSTGRKIWPAAPPWKRKNKIYSPKRRRPRKKRRKKIKKPRTKLEPSPTRKRSQTRKRNRRKTLAMAGTLLWGVPCESHTDDSTIWYFAAVLRFSFDCLVGPNREARGVRD